MIAGTQLVTGPEGHAPPRPPVTSSPNRGAAVALALAALFTLALAGGCRSTAPRPRARFSLPTDVEPGQLDTETAAGSPPAQEQALRESGLHRQAVDELARKTTMSGDPPAIVVGDIRTAATARPLHSRVLVRDGGCTEPGAVLASVGFWCDGRFRLRVLPGVARVTVTAGRRRTVATPELRLKPGGRGKVRVDLHRPAALAFEERGWIGVDLFRPVAAGDALRREPTLELLALAARAEGVAFVGAARPWSPEGFRRGEEDREATSSRCGRLSDDAFTIAPVGSGSDAPLYGRIFYLGSRREGETNGPTPVWDVGRPNFLVTEEVHAGGGVVVPYGIADARELDPRAEIVAIRPDLADMYRDAAVALSNVACELPFDVVSGVLPDALALSGSEAEFEVWFRLLEMGYRLPAVHVEGGSFAEGVLPAERTFLMLDASGKRRSGAPSVEEVAAALRAGRAMASNGAFVFLTIAGLGPGAVLEADGLPRPVRIEAFSSTLKDDNIHAVEFLRDGEIIESISGLGRTTIAATLTMRETETSWYVARVRSGPRGERVAWTSPVYFEGPGYSPPRPARTRVRGRVVDARTSEPLAARVEAFLEGERLAEATSVPQSGAYEILCSPAARIEAKAEGYATASARVFFHTEAPQLIKGIHTDEWGKGASILAEEATYERMRLATGEAEIDLRLRPLR